MKQIPAGVFKARCLAVMKKVQSTGEPVVVTKRGVPIVKLVRVRAKKDDIFGFAKHKIKFIGDVESPIPVEWGTITE
jgi:prevent-host-death family protein